MKNTTAAALLSILALAACGDDTGTGAGGSSEGGAGGGGTGGEAPEGKGTGFVALLTLSSTSGTAYANYSGANLQESVGCTTEEVAGCTLVECPIANAEGGAGGGVVDPTYLSAGTITITAGADTLTLTPDDESSYSLSLNEAAFAAGDEVTFTVEGAGDIPAHEGAVTAPPTIQFQEPDFSTLTTIDRSADFALAWTGAPGGDVSVTVGVVRAGTSTATIQCLFDSADGQGTIPSAALSKLPVTSGPDDNAYISVSSLAMDEVDAGDYAVTFYAAATALNVDGSIAVANLLELQ